MFCGVSTTSMSVIACHLTPHEEEPGDCGNFSCLPCYKYVEEHISICPNAKVVCTNSFGCNRSKTMRAPPVVCECTRPVCVKCYPIEDFMKSGVCQICDEKKQLLAVKREEEEEGGAAPVAKRARE